MQLTSFTDYSLRVLMYLTAVPDGLTTVENLSSLYGISRNHMVKIVHSLSTGGYIKSYKGRGGGICLSCNPDTVTIGALVREFEQNVILVECFSKLDNTCKISKVCRLKGILGEALEAFFMVLDGYTLKDAVGNESLIRKYLDSQI